MPTSFQSRLATIATQQFNTYRYLHETDTLLKNQIRRYWTDIGLGYPGVGPAWSAVFVSWNILKAGATAAEFRFSQRHAEFVHWAINQAGLAGALFIGHDIAAYAPKVGDIIQNNRDGNAFDFAYASTHPNYKSHAAIVVETGTDASGRYMLTIGGNENDTVGRRIVRLRPSGLVKQPVPNHFISIIETLK